ncbi:MAG: hypothetical protein ACXVRZ_13270 [Gaiellaceae bacterium]
MSTVIAPTTREVVPARALRWLGVFVAVAALVLVAALATGATAVFNVVVFALFAVLWLSFAAALVSSPSMLDSAWSSLRQRHMLVQALAWLLFLPLAAALYVWERGWRAPLRLVIIAAIAGLNLLMFFPR